MPATAVITVRVHPDLLAALKERVRRDGTTVSAAIVRLVANDLTSRPVRATKSRRTMGMFPNFAAPTFDEFRARRRLARQQI